MDSQTGQVITAGIAMLAIALMEMMALMQGHNGLVLSGSVGAVVAIFFKREEIYAKICKPGTDSV